MDLKDVKKKLMTGGPLYLSVHTKKRMQKRGYTKGDILSAIFTGTVVERQGVEKLVISGKDKDNNPIVVIVGKKEGRITVITVMPPLDIKRFPECV